MVSSTLLVGAGGVLGALARHLLGERIDIRTVDTLAVNVLGSFVLGLLVAVPVADSLFRLFGTGFCGAFTTFSTFAFETVRLYETGERRRAAATAALNLVGALAAVALGTAVASLL
ncbi:CrcB protein [Halorientalis persicus]|uniref:Fluoride-specific ion channel FluC n=1 Tax=Halorientalis persicus TaxID=1367881 RepID=A0A1H8RGY6_9EURY|nr:CrcB family protein [Halorientalis persicus]SEO65626.1 CrcB protein [Halorientalis persicus]